MYMYWCLCFFEKVDCSGCTFLFVFTASWQAKPTSWAVLRLFWITCVCILYMCVCVCTLWISSLLVVYDAIDNASSSRVTRTEN